MKPRNFFLTLLPATLVLGLASCDRSADHHGDDHADQDTHWSYQGETGPGHWGDLDDAWKVAKEGKQQSPIDISGEIETPTAPPLEPSYRETGLNLKNNGHTVTQTYDPDSSITVDGAKYDLAQFHFHHKSEHTVDGKQFELECHLVHKNADGNLLVVGVLFNEGAENPLLAKLWPHLPATAGASKADAATKLNIKDLLPADLAYYHYQGSLTTPPCSEGVKWYVLENSVTASAEQIAAFAKLFPNNFRPVQPLFDRKITSN